MLKYLFAIFIIFLFIVINILKNKITKNRLFILKTILIVLFLEVTVFNINAYRTDFGNLNYMGFAGEDLTDKISITTDNTQYISIEKIDSKVKSIYLELSNVEDKVVDYDIFYSDESTSNRYLASKNYCEDVEKTKYSCISLSRKL